MWASASWFTGSCIIEGHFQWVVVRGTHIHHLVWGILILLLVGYGWLLDLGRTHSPLSIFFSRLMAVGYGVGAALTLDEFAIWLDLEPNAYWSSAGRLNIDAIILFGALLAWEPGARRSSAACTACGTSAASTAESSAGG